MPVRGPTLLLLLIFCGLLFAGCVSREDGPVGISTTEVRNHTPSLVYSGDNQKYTYARSLVPVEISGFVLETRGKEPMTIWMEPYHFRGFWIPENSSKFNGSVKSLSVDVFVYSDKEAASAWYRDFEADSDRHLIVQGIDTLYRFREGAAVIAFMRDDIIILSSSIVDGSSAESITGERAAQEAAVTGAEMLIKNIS